MKLTRGPFKKYATREGAGLTKKVAKSDTGEMGCCQKIRVTLPNYFGIGFSVTQFFLLCISCSSDNITNRINKKASNRLCVPLR